MRRLALAGHYGKQVEIDLCPPCHLVWFDALESVRLAGSGMLSLLGEMALGQQQAHHLLGAAASCPRCAGALKTVHNRSRWGPTLQLECRQGHGCYQTFAQYLSEKGLVRPLSVVDRARLMAQPHGLHCLNCGGAIGQGDERCSFCDGVPGLFDVARLARALDPEGATEQHAVHTTAARHKALACLACGAPLPQGQSSHCDHCGATLAVGSLAEAHEAVKVLEQALREHASRPAAHVVRRRLDALDRNLARQRDDAKEMQRQAGGYVEPEERNFLEDWRNARGPMAGMVVFLLLLWAVFYR